MSYFIFVFNSSLETRFAKNVSPVKGYWRRVLAKQSPMCLTSVTQMWRRNFFSDSNKLWAASSMRVSYILWVDQTPTRLRLALIQHLHHPRKRLLPAWEAQSLNNNPGKRRKISVRMQEQSKPFLDGLWPVWLYIASIAWRLTFGLSLLHIWSNNRWDLLARWMFNCLSRWWMPWRVIWACSTQHWIQYAHADRRKKGQQLVKCWRNKKTSGFSHSNEP